MEDKLTFEELYEAYSICLKNKKRKIGTYGFVNEELCANLMRLLEELNNRKYTPRPSNCYVVTDPALREIYAAQFADRIVQHFYMKEIDKYLEKDLIYGCCSCRKEKGTGYALELLNKFLVETSKNGTKDCFFLKIDLSGYFMSIDRKKVGEKFSELIKDKYVGKHKDLLLYLTPIIFENNPAENCIYKCADDLRKKVPDRRKMDPNSIYGMAIGNLTSQAGSNLNLNEFDHYVTEEINLRKYIRYVDDIVIVSSNKKKLINLLPNIIEKLGETHQYISRKKTKIDTAYHGVPFLGKVSYPYGYQTAKKETIIRLYQRAKELEYTDEDNFLAKANSQIGLLKKYNCRKLIQNYYKIIENKVPKSIFFDEKEFKFQKFK